MAFVNRIATLLGQSPSGTPADVTPRIARSVPNPRNAGHRTRWMSLGALGLAAALGGGWQVWQRAVTHSADHRALTTTVEPQGSDKRFLQMPQSCPFKVLAATSLSGADAVGTTSPPITPYRPCESVASQLLSPSADRDSENCCCRM